MAAHIRAELVVDVVDMAATVRDGQTEGTIVHSDRVSQYVSDDHAKAMWWHRIRQSVGRTGVCWDTTVAESFLSSLKRELVSQHRFLARTDAHRAIFEWINRYNTRRLHSSFGYRSPNNYEANLNRQTNQAA